MSLIFEKFPLGRSGGEGEPYEELIPLEALLPGGNLSPDSPLPLGYIWKGEPSLSGEVCSYT